jgi:hypothetical protein
MLRIALWSCCAATLLAAAAPAAGQLVIDRSAAPAYPMPPKVEPQEEKAEEKGPPTYSGERIRIGSDCSPATLAAAGTICSAASPCELWLELTAAREAGGAAVAVGDLYAASAAVESIVLRTADDGETWTEAAARIPGAALDELHFVDGEHGWILGRELSGGGQRPILLATDDSGASWARRQIDDDEDYRGAVLQMRFDSPKHGYVIVERPAGAGDPFEMRETFNGGRSWSLLQVTADRPALPGSRRRIPEPTARVREDSADNSLAVERREGESWLELGRFEGSAGACGAE